MNITNMTALQISRALKSKEFLVKDVLDEVFSSIDKNEKKLNCYVSFQKEKAYKKAEEVQAIIDKGTSDSPLIGVPVAVKDNICTKGVLTTCSSRMLSDFRPTYNATVVERMEKAGMIIIGKTNLDEFAMGSTTETSYYGVTKNPWDTSRVSGGSSGGSAAAVSANEAVIALGSDTGGSIRQPSAFCGVTGLKPTYSTVSRYGLIAFASSLDQIGPIGRDALDCAALYEIISGKDKNDATTASFDKFDYKEILNHKIKGLKIGVPSSYFGDGLSCETKKSIQEAIDTFKNLGAEVEFFDFSITKYAVPTYYIISCAEACSNLSRYDGIKYGFSSDKVSSLAESYVKNRSEGFGLEVKRRIMLGNFVLSSGYYDAYYNKALKAKSVIKKSFSEAFEKYDIILGPVTPDVAPKIGENLSDVLKMYMADIYTVMANIAGLPALSIPCGFDSNNLPVGLQLIGKPFDEKTILGAAYNYQQNTKFHEQTPQI